MKTLHLWACNTNADGTEGRGPEIPVLYAENYETAQAIAKNPAFYRRYGVMGCDNCYVSEHQILIFEDFKDFEENYEDIQRIKKRQCALNKLTKEEREILGLE